MFEVLKSNIKTLIFNNYFIQLDFHFVIILFFCHLINLLDFSLLSYYLIP